jgi:hypothetical protein
MKNDCTGTMRKEERKYSNVIFCDKCSQRWCELCLQRVHSGVKHQGTLYCKKIQCQQFCEKYLSSNDSIKAKCELKYSWIKLYAISQMNNDAAMDWIKENGQICPICGLGIERVEGCIHMECCDCLCYFCYVCGVEIFYPFDTHHCWDDSMEDEYT